MSRIAYVNGRYVPHRAAQVHVEDRGYQFADGVYEVCEVRGGKLVDERRHMDRLERSLSELRIAMPMPRNVLGVVLRETVARNRVRDGLVYLQITRGVCERNHRFPKNQCHTVLWYGHDLPPAQDPGEGEGVKLLAVQDERWKRCWIKCIGLIANVLAKNEATGSGYDEAVFVERDIVTECATSNLFAVLGGTLVTHPVGAKVLPGISRLVTLDCATKLGIRVEERALREEEVRRADELFITSTTREIHWVQRWNDRYIGQGKCGPMTIKLHRAFRDRVRAETSREIAA